MPAGQSEGAGHGNSSSGNAQVVKPGTKSGEIGGIKNVAKETPRGGDKPKLNK